jgi:hypothetical protein
VNINITLRSLLAQTSFLKHNITFMPWACQVEEGLVTASLLRLVMNPYRYSPLPPDGDEIRLLRLLPGPASADIEIEIFHAKTSPNPVYEALSYVWGPSERCDHVLVREAVKPRSRVSNIVHRFNHLQLRKPKTESHSRYLLPITKNLSIALHYLKLPGEPRTLWIDAICINQDDLSERSREVIKMGSIYSNAKQVLLWLGPSSDNSSLALETLGKISEGIDFVKEENSIYYKHGGWAGQIRHNPEALKSYAQNWVAIRDLLRREWFSRLWVFQEVGLAARATIIVGHDSLDWNSFAVGLHWIWANRTEVNESTEEVAIEEFGPSNIAGFLYRWRRNVIGFTQLMDVTKNLLCSDPRDQLFAIRSLTTPQVQSIIIPDYSKTVEETLKIFALRWIRHYRDLAILRKCLWKESTSNFKLPSWVPNLFLSDRPDEIVYFGASYSRAVFVYQEEQQSLAVTGIQVATISHITTPIRVSYTDSEILEHCRSWKRLILNSSLNRDSSVSDAFLATLTSGQIKEMLPEAVGSLMSFEDIKNALNLLQSSGKDEKALLSRFATEVRTDLNGRSFFLTEEGLFGVCSQFSRCGDRVAVLLGCYSPLILRPTIVEGSNCFIVIGESYVEGLMNNQALLGPIPEGWRLHPVHIEGRTVPGYANANTTTQQDPRAPLPPGWRYIYGSIEEPQEIEPDNEDEMTEVWFENVVTGESTQYDPRLTPEALRQRGVELQELVLV